MNKDIMKAFGFDKELKLIDKGKCPFCGKNVKASDFSDELSKKEFLISGLCRSCQNKMFG